jgi:hypothetical protein
VPAWYDPNTKETRLAIEGQVLTIPDYMTISDIVYFVQEKENQAAQRLIQQVTYGMTDQQTPLEKAMSHYKERGWFAQHDD